MVRRRRRQINEDGEEERRPRRGRHLGYDSGGVGGVVGGAGLAAEVEGKDAASQERGQLFLLYGFIFRSRYE